MVKEGEYTGLVGKTTVSGTLPRVRTETGFWHTSFVAQEWAPKKHAGWGVKQERKGKDKQGCDPGQSPTLAWPTGTELWSRNHTQAWFALRGQGPAYCVKDEWITGCVLFEWVGKGICRAKSHSNPPRRQTSGERGQQGALRSQHSRSRGMGGCSKRSLGRAQTVHDRNWHLKRKRCLSFSDYVPGTMLKNILTFPHLIFTTGWIDNLFLFLQMKLKQINVK